MSLKNQMETFVIMEHLLKDLLGDTALKPNNGARTKILFAGVGGLFEHKNNVLTGRYFSTCLLRDVEKNRWIPKPTRTIDCVEVEIAPDDWIMAVDADNTDLFLLSCDYNIVWKQCPCLEGVRLEDVTPELSDLAYNEVKNS